MGVAVLVPVGVLVTVGVRVRVGVRVGTAVRVTVAVRVGRGVHVGSGVQVENCASTVPDLPVVGHNNAPVSNKPQAIPATATALRFTDPAPIPTTYDGLDSL